MEGGYIIVSCGRPYLTLHTHYAGAVKKLGLSADSLFKMERHIGAVVSCGVDYKFACIQECLKAVGGKVKCRAEDYGAARILPPTCVHTVCTVNQVHTPPQSLVEHPSTPMLTRSSFHSSVTP